MKKRQILGSLMASGAVIGGLVAGLTTPVPSNQDLIPVAVNAPAPSAQPAPTNYVHAPEISAKAGLVLEANSGKVLFEHHADDRLPIASMTKVATLGVIYQALADGTLTMETPVLVSERAASMGGSQAFLDAGSTYSVRDLVQSIVVASANDSCVALAEQVAGSVESFVERMNAFARDCGCQNTNFVNCTGLPTPGAYSCARDMARMYQRIMQSPHYGDFNHVWMYDLTHPSGRITGLTNTNKLIRNYDGCLGGKTGFTSEAGHCLTVAAARDDLRPIAVVIGAPDSKTRFAESRELLDYAFQGFVNQRVVDHTVPVQNVTLTNAVLNEIPVFPAQDFYYLTAKGTVADLAVASEIPGKVAAPLQTDTTLGKIMVLENGKVLAEIPVVPGAAVPAANYWENLRKITQGAKL